MKSKNFNNIVDLLKDYLAEGEIHQIEVDDRNEIAVAYIRAQKTMVVYNCDLNSTISNFDEASFEDKKDAIKLLAKKFIEAQIGVEYMVKMEFKMPSYIYFTNPSSYNYLYDVIREEVSIDPIYDLSHFNRALSVDVETATQKLFNRIFNEDIKFRRKYD